MIFFIINVAKTVNSRKNSSAIISDTRSFLKDIKPKTVPSSAAIRAFCSFIISKYAYGTPSPLSAPLEKSLCSVEFLAHSGGINSY